MVFRVNANGVVCIALVYAIIGYCDYAVTIHMIGGSLAYSAWGLMNIVFFNTLIALLFLSHVKAMISDPGMVPLIPTKEGQFFNHEQMKEGCWTLCSKCQIERPPLTYHCRICNRCIRKMSHHCPWINNCIGEKNIKYVFMISFYTVLATIFCSTMIATFWLLHPPYLSNQQKRSKALHSIFLAVIGVFFSVFSLSVVYDQFTEMRAQNSEDDEDGTVITNYQSLKSDISDVFNGVHPMLWMIPLNISPRRKRDNETDRLPLLPGYSS